MRSIFVVLLIVMTGAGCAPLATRGTSEISAQSQRWLASFNAGDVKTLTAIYTADARMMAPNAPMAQGHAAIAASFGEMTSAGMKTTTTCIDLVAAGDIGYQVGTYALLAPDGAEIDHGKFIELWKRVDGSWKISHDMFSSDLPAAPESGKSPATFLFTHEVENPARWLAAWRGENSRHELFARHGAPRVQLFENLTDARQKALVVEVTDLTALEAMLSSPEGAQAKAADGVVSDSIRIYGPIE